MLLPRVLHYNWCDDCLQWLTLIQPGSACRSAPYQYFGVKRSTNWVGVAHLLVLTVM